MKILLTVDVQPEFATDKRGKKLYNDLCDYITIAHQYYDTIIAFIYKNDSNLNMSRYVHWEEMSKIEPVDYRADYYYIHSSYFPDEVRDFHPDDEITVVGFDTDACVLSALFNLFNKGSKFRVLQNGVYSSGGKHMHDIGIEIIKRQFGDALDSHTRLM